MAVVAGVQQAEAVQTGSLGVQQVEAVQTGSLGVQVEAMHSLAVLQAEARQTVSLLAQLVAEVKKANSQLEGIEKAAKASEVKLNFLEGRSDGYTCHSHDWRRHRHQMREQIVEAKTYEEKRDTKKEYSQWRTATFWMIWQQSAVRAIGFAFEEACMP